MYLILTLISTAHAGELVMWKWVLCRQLGEMCNQWNGNWLMAVVLCKAVVIILN